MIKLNGFKEVMPSANEAVSDPYKKTCRRCGERLELIGYLTLCPDCSGRPEPKPAKKIINLLCTEPEPEPEKRKPFSFLKARYQPYR